MKYCPNCNQNVQPDKKFSIGWFLFSCITVVGGGVYIIYWALFKKKTCPICGGRDFGKPLSQINQTGHITTPQATTGDKVVSWLADSNKKTEGLIEKLQKKNEEAIVRRNQKKEKTL